MIRCSSLCSNRAFTIFIGYALCERHLDEFYRQIGSELIPREGNDWQHRVWEAVWEQQLVDDEELVAKAPNMMIDD